MAIIFSANWESGTVNSGWQNYEYPSNNPNAASRSTDFAREGTYSCKFTLNSTDNNAQNGNRRVEFTLNNSTNPNQNYRWYGYSWYFPASTMPSDNRECVIIQWHDKAIANPGCSPCSCCPNCGCSTSPFLAIEAKNDRFRAMIRYNTPTCTYCGSSQTLQIFDMGLIPKDQWVDTVIFYNPRADSSGRVQIWMGGELKLDYTGPCFANGSYFPYLKFGIYKWLWNGSVVTPGSMTIYADRFRIGDTNSSYAEVAPPTGGGTNNPPVVSAGANEVVSSVTTSKSITGTATDGDGTIASTTWTNVSGPNTPTIVSPSALTTNVTGLIPGTYTFRLSATDDDGATASATKTLRVNTLPTVDLSGNTTSYPVGTTSISLSSLATDPDGTIVSRLWTRVEGPNIPTIVSPTATSTNITGLVQGTYTFQMSVSDNNGEIAAEQIQISIAEQTLVTKSKKRFTLAP